MDSSIYDTKPHVWDDEMRLVLAKTIGKAYSINNDIGESKKRSSETEKDTLKIQRCQ